MSDHSLGALNSLDLETNSEGAETKEQSHSVQDGLSVFDRDLQKALREKDLATARSIVADAEAVLAAHNRTTVNESQIVAMSKPHLAGAKAKIAMTAGDPTAARAILVQAIERWPDVPPLRAMMTEVMLASGRAKDVRPVLTHLGRQNRSLELSQAAAKIKKDSSQ